MVSLLMTRRRTSLSEHGRTDGWMGFGGVLVTSTVFIRDLRN